MKCRIIGCEKEETENSLLCEQHLKVDVERRERRKREIELHNVWFYIENDDTIMQINDKCNFDKYKLTEEQKLHLIDVLQYTNKMELEKVEKLLL